MADPYNHTTPVQGHPRKDGRESGVAYFQSEEEVKRQRRKKMYKYIGIIIVVQIIILTAIGLTVMKVKTPKVRLGNINVQSLNSVAASPSFETSFTTQIRIKNANWGSYKFDAATVTFSHQGMNVGQVAIPKSKAGMLSTKKIAVAVSLSSHGLPSNSNLGTELKSGVLTLSSQAKLSGKVELMMILKKKKSATMDCAMTFDLSTKTVKTLQCK